MNMDARLKGKALSFMSSVGSLMSTASCLKPHAATSKVRSIATQCQLRTIGGLMTIVPTRDLLTFNHPDNRILSQNSRHSVVCLSIGEATRIRGWCHAKTGKKYSV